MVWTVCDSSPLETMSAAGHCNIETTESHWYIQYVWFGAGHMIIETMRQTKMSTRWHFSNYQVVEYFNISGCIITRFWPYRTTLLSINCTEELQYYTFSWLFALLWSSILICQVFAGWFKKKKKPHVRLNSVQLFWFSIHYLILQMQHIHLWKLHMHTPHSYLLKHISVLQVSHRDLPKFKSDEPINLFILASHCCLTIIPEKRHHLPHNCTDNIIHWNTDLQWIW